MEECLSQSIICKLCTKMSQFFWHILLNLRIGSYLILMNITNRWHSIASVAKFIRQKFGWRSICKSNMQNTCNIFDVILLSLIPAQCNYSMCFLNGPVTSTFFFTMKTIFFALCNFPIYFLNFPITKHHFNKFHIEFLFLLLFHLENSIIEKGNNQRFLVAQWNIEIVVSPKNLSPPS